MMERIPHDRRIGLIVLVCLAAVLVCGCGGDDGTTPTPTPEPSWSQDGIAWTAPYGQDPSYPSNLSYQVDGTTVHLQGMANAGSTHVQSGQLVCTLPEGARPPAGEAAIVLCPTWGWPGGGDGEMGAAGITILPDGRLTVRTVQQYDGQMQFLEFDGISFSTVTGADGWTRAGMAWTAPYTADGDYPSTLEFRKVGVMVEFRGFANAGGTHVHAGDVIGVLPESYRPTGANSAMLLAATWGWPAAVPDGYVGNAGVFVEPDGTVRVKTVQQYDGEQQFLNFDGLAFSTVEDTGGWTDEGMTYTTPYTASGSYPSYLKFMKSGATVRLRSVVNAGGTHVTSGQVVGTLPADYRPATDESHFYLCPTWGWPGGHPDGYIGTAGVQIWPDGTIHVISVQPFDGQMQFLGFDGKRFSTSWTGLQ